MSNPGKPILAVTQAIRGTRDLLPSETFLWQRVERIAQDVFATYGFGEIRLPIFERASLFERENARIAPGLAKLYEGTRPPTMRRYGETDDKSEELI